MKNNHPRTNEQERSFRYTTGIDHTLVLNIKPYIYAQTHSKNHLTTLSPRLDTRLLSLQLRLLILLDLRINLFLLLPRLLPLILIWSPNSDILRLIIREGDLQSLFNNPAASIVNHHHAGKHGLELGGKRHELEPLIDFGYEFGRTGEGDTGDEHETPEHALILADGFTEGTALIVDCKGRDLLYELEKVNGGIEKIRLELLLEVNFVEIDGFETLDVLRDVDERSNVDGELAKDGADDVGVEDVMLGAFLR
jgi:hypothetical protein